MYIHGHKHVMGSCMQIRGVSKFAWRDLSAKTHLEYEEKKEAKVEGVHQSLFETLLKGEEGDIPLTRNRAHPPADCPPGTPQFPPTLTAE